jgi:CubicO group peptidase (beta-lactamase class C family)
MMAIPTQISENVDADFRKLCDYTVEVMEKTGVPGVAVGVICDGREQTAGFGVTNVNHPLPVTSDTLFQIGSTTKTFTATAAMCLVEAGKLDLDTPIRKYLPDLKLPSPETTENITMRHLLTHVGGWDGDFFQDTGDGDDALSVYVRMMADLEQVTPIGALWTYNNAGFSLAGRVIEAVTGKPYEAAIKELIFEPLGMDMSFFFAKDVMVRSFVVGHQVNDDKQAEVVLHWPIGRGSHPAGGVASTVKDQLKYARFHLGDGTAQGERVLSPESMKLMQTAQVKGAGNVDAVGLSWMLRTLNGTRLVGHGGATSGQLSEFQLIPERGFGITVLTNGAPTGTLPRAGSDILEWALKHYFGLEETKPVAQPRPDSELAQYVGTYNSRVMALEVSAKDGELVVQLKVNPEMLGVFQLPDEIPPEIIGFYDTDKATDKNGGLWEFIRNPDGSLAWIRAGIRVYKRA